VGLLLQPISMDYCILLGCVIVGLQVQPVCMTMSILTSWWKSNQVIGSISNHQTNYKIPCGWTRNYILIFVLEYIVKQLKLRVLWKIPVTKLMILFLYSCPHGPSCVMGDVETTSWSHSYLPLNSGNTVLRVTTREFGLHLVVSSSVGQYQSRLFLH
jgi:hypothetical protein